MNMWIKLLDLNKNMSSLICCSVIYLCVLTIIKADESTTKKPEKPLDPGSESFRFKLPTSVLTLPPREGQLRLRQQADLDDFEAALASIPGQPLRVRKKFSNSNPASMAIAKAARAQEWSRLFGFEGMR